MNCWDILGIKPTDNLREIKRAYATKSREVHPEEHPEEFSKLHEAYEQATNFAKSKLVPPVAPPQPQPDTSEVEVEEEDDLVERVETATVEEQGYADSTDWRAPVNEEDEGYINFDEIFQKSDIENNREVVRCSNLVFEKFREFVAAGEKSDKAWTSVFKSMELGFAASSPYFLAKMTDFVRENEKLPKCFYRELSVLYRLDAIATRERQGIFEELIAIVAERKMVVTPESQAKANKVEAWAYLIFGIVFIVLQIAARNYEGTPMVVYYIFFALLVIFFIVRAALKKRDKKKRMTEEEERVEEIEKKQHREARLSMGPIHHIKKPMYYSRVTLAAWAVLSSLGFLQVMLEYEDFGAVVALLAWAGGGTMLAICLLTNLIAFIRHKVSKVPIYVPPLTEEEKKQKKNAFIVLMCIVAFFVVGAIVVA
ncbi:MAG: J domain-containing protein [Oscillospiraceae bacterium]|nr:J domain-containing protein [Candidatus Limimonas egerieequi]